MLKPYIILGKQPQHANGFLTPVDFGTEQFFDMTIGYDSDTGALRLMEPCKRELLFNDHYAFYSKTSRRMIEHFKATAILLNEFVHDGVVVEIGSNDGVMQDAWKELGVTCIGIEPSGNVADVAIENGHKVLKEFVNKDTASKVGIVDVVFGANVSCHITDIDEYFESVALMIKDHGVFVFEDPYFLDVYEKCSYDQFYGEHTWMFTVKFIEKKLLEHGLRLFNLEHLWVHGGSMRFYATANPKYLLSGIFMNSTVIEKQKEREGDIAEKLENLKERIALSKDSFKNLLESLRGKNICGFGATSKGVVITNYCGIDSTLVPFITDTTPAKIGLHYPGSHIPIVAQKDFDYSEMDYMVCFAWNHFDEIKGLNLNFKGKWIMHVPYPRIV